MSETSITGRLEHMRGGQSVKIADSVSATIRAEQKFSFVYAEGTFTEGDCCKVAAPNRVVQGTIDFIRPELGLEGVMYDCRITHDWKLEATETGSPMTSPTMRFGAVADMDSRTMMGSRNAIVGGVKGRSCVIRFTSYEQVMPQKSVHYFTAEPIPKAGYFGAAGVPTATAEEQKILDKLDWSEVDAQWTGN